MDFSDATDTVETADGHYEVPPPEIAEPEDVERYNLEFAKSNGIAPDFRNRNAPADGGGDAEPFAKQDSDEVARNAKHRARFPWLHDPSRGVRWDFNPIALRNLSQTNTWVGMLVQSISKEIAETPWTIVDAEGRTETQKRLSTHPEERTHKSVNELPDATAERIHDLLMRPNPDITWQDMVEMWMGDLLEIGSLATVKAFHRSAYQGDEFAADADSVEPRALMPTAPEVWTKEYHDKTGLLEGYWQFDDHRSPGAGTTDDGTVGRRGGGDPDFFDSIEVMWSDMTPRTNRRYGIPPTLLVEDFLQSLDLAVTQEQQYLSRGSIPSGAWVFEEWDREHMKERRQEMEENVTGKPHKSLMFAGQGGDVKFEPMSMNFQELEFTERMKWYARVVASAFQVPTAVVGIEPERVNYNTFQGERENFESNTLGPYLQKLERVINMELIRPHWGADTYRFEFKPGMSESTRAMISERVTREFSQEIRTRNEARREIGLDPVDNEQDGFKSEVSEGDDGGALDELGLSQSDDSRSTALHKQDIPDNAYTIDDPSECGGSVVQGPQGGTYCVPDGENGGGPDAGGGDAIVESVSDLPAHLNPENAEEVEDFESGRVGQDEDMRIARMPDGNDILVKPGSDSGKTDVVASEAIRELGGSAPETAYVEEEDAVIQSLEGEGDVTEVPADTESYTETFASTVAIGEADPNASNFVVADDGEVSNIDTETIEDVSAGWVQDTIRMEIEDQYQDMGYSSQEAAISAITDAMKSQAEDIDTDELVEELPDIDESEQIAENIETIQSEGIDLGKSVRDSGNADVRKEALRNTDEWAQFDVQPGMVEDLADEIAGDEEFDGFQDEVVEDTSPEDALGDIMQSATEDGDEVAKYTDVDAVSMTFPPGGEVIDHDESDWSDFLDALDSHGVVFQDWKGLQVHPDDTLESHDHATHIALRDGDIADVESVLADFPGVRYGIQASTVSSFDVPDGHEPDPDLYNGDISDIGKSAGDSGNADVRKEALRNTDDWAQFDVQPAMVQDLADEIAGDVSELFERVLDDDEVLSIIDRLAVADETEKSLSALSRRLREIFEDSDVVARVQRALREETADAAAATVEETLAEAADADVETEVDIEAIREQLGEREVTFADRFADELKDDILDTVGDGWAEGQGTRDIAADIAEQADINEGWTGAERIARQELHVATGQARSEVGAQLGKVEVWEHSGDYPGRDGARESHHEMTGKWKFPEDSWEVDYSPEGGPVVTEPVAGDSEWGIGCRCTSLLRDRETVDDADYAGDGALG